MIKPIYFTIILIPLIVSIAYSQDNSKSDFSYSISLDIGRLFPQYDFSETKWIQDEQFDIQRKVEDDMSYGLNFKLKYKKRYFIEAGLNLFFGQENLTGDIINQDIGGDIESNRDYRKLTILTNMGFILFQKNKFSPYISIGPTWSNAYIDQANIDSNFYPINYNDDESKKAQNTLKAAKISKILKDSNLDKTDDNAFGFNVAAGLNYDIEKNVLLDFGLRYIHDSMNLDSKSDITTNAFNLFLGIGIKFGN
jgi:opacity protein-like surface antigen